MSTIRLSADFSAEILQDRREWNNTLKISKNKTVSPNTLSSKVIIKDMKDKVFHSQTKTKGIYQH